MNSRHNELEGNTEVTAPELMAAERSLRLIASLPAPAGLEDRVKAGLRGAPAKAGVIAWPGTHQVRWTQAWYMRAAAAAAIVFVVVGGGWGVHARFKPAPEPAAEAAPQRIGGGGGFSSAGAMRKPTTVEGPKVVAPEKQKPTGVQNRSTKKSTHSVVDKKIKAD